MLNFKKILLLWFIFLAGMSFLCIAVYGQEKGVFYFISAAFLLLLFFAVLAFGMFPRILASMRQAREYDTILKKFIAELSALSTIEKIGKTIVHFLLKNVPFKYGEILTFDPEAGTFTTLYRHGTFKGGDFSRIKNSPIHFTDDRLHINIYDSFLIWLEEHDRIITLCDLQKVDKFNYEPKSEILDYFMAANINVLIPLTLNFSLIGIVHLGQLDSKSNNLNCKSRTGWKKFFSIGNNVISKQHLDILEKLRFHASVSLSHALLYQRIRRLNENLEEKVRERTQELEMTTAQLVQSEKMASIGLLVAGIAHEVNTPAGVVNGSVENMIQTSRSLLQDFPRLVQLRIQTPDFLRLMQITQYLLIHRSIKRLNIKDKMAAVKENSAWIEKFLHDHYGSNKKASQKLIAESEMDVFVKDFAKLIVEQNLEKYRKPLTVMAVRYGFPLIMSLIERIANVGVSFFNIKYAISNIVRIIQALKNYSRTEESHAYQMNIKDGIENTLIIMENSIKQLGKMETDFADLPEIVCHGDELNQVWTNLINNAVHAMELRIQAGQIKQEQTHLRVATYMVSNLDDIARQYSHTAQTQNQPYQGPWVIVEIGDNGIGISDTIKNNIFKPFFTTKKHGEGTGLGLGIVVNIINKHNGRIFLHSQPGKTVFLIAIPKHWLHIESGIAK